MPTSNGGVFRVISVIPSPSRPTFPTRPRSSCQRMVSAGTRSRGSSASCLTVRASTMVEGSAKSGSSSIFPDSRARGSGRQLGPSAGHSAAALHARPGEGLRARWLGGGRYGVLGPLPFKAAIARLPRSNPAPVATINPASARGCPENGLRADGSIQKTQRNERSPKYQQERGGAGRSEPWRHWISAGRDHRPHHHAAQDHRDDLVPDREQATSSTKKRK